VDRARATGKDTQFTAWRHVTPQHNTVLTITKTRLRFLQGLVLEADPQDPVTPGRELGRRIATDLGGEPAVPASPPAVSAPVQQVEPAELKKLWALITKYRVDHEAFRTSLNQTLDELREMMTEAAA
jgi:hypothetical protein